LATKSGAVRINKEKIPVKRKSKITGITSIAEIAAACSNNFTGLSALG